MNLGEGKTPYNIGEMFGNGKENLEVHQHNLNSDMYRSEISKNLESITLKFKTIGKSMTDLIKKDDLLQFLDKNVLSGKFDRSVAEKIFGVLEEVKGDLIPINEFTKTYIQIVEELKINVEEIQDNYNNEQKELANYKAQLAEFRNEILNSEQINESQAKFTIFLKTIEFVSPNNKFIGVHLLLRFGDEVRDTTKQNNGFEWNQSFEFNVTKTDFVIYELYSYEKKLAEMRFHLKDVETQDEYEVLLEMIDDNKITIAKVNCKIHFVWSFFNYYQALYNKTEARINQLNQTIIKSNKILDILIEPFGLTDNTNKMIGNPENQEASEIYDLGASKILRRFTSSEKEYQLQEKLDDILKTRFSGENSPWVYATKVLVGAIILIAFITTFAMANFLNLIVLGYMFLIISTSISSNYLGYFNQFFTLILFLIIYDVLWFLFASESSSTYDGGVENGLKRITFLLKLIEFGIKCLLVLILWLGIVKYEKDKTKERLMNTSSNQHLSGK